MVRPFLRESAAQKIVDAGRESCEVRFYRIVNRWGNDGDPSPIPPKTRESLVVAGRKRSACAFQEHPQSPMKAVGWASAHHQKPL
jgi:hypothetical protein